MTRADSAPHCREAYTERLASLAVEQNSLGNQQSNLILLMIGLAAAAGWSIYTQQWLAAPPCVIGALVALGFFRQLREKDWDQVRVRRFYEAALARLDGDWRGKGRTGKEQGEEYRDGKHPYSEDLNIFGAGSLFERLCQARTDIGRRQLAALLSTHAPVAEALARRQAVEELRPRRPLREKLELLGEFAYQECSWETFEGWLQSPKIDFPSWLRPAGIALVLAWLAIGIAALLRLVPYEQAGQAAILVLGLQGMLAGQFQEQVKRVIASIKAIGQETKMLEDGMRLALAENFTAPKLVALQATLREAMAHVSALRAKQRWLEYRDLEVFYGPSLLLMWATQWSIELEAWRQQHGSKLSAWAEAWGEFEALSSIAMYADEQSDGRDADWAGKGATLEATNLKHPLLEDCVANSVSLNPTTRFYVISGSNMAGKSTFLRAIGLNLVLAKCGAPVRADSFAAGDLRLGCAIQIEDSLLEGRSRFLAEVERLKRILDLAAEGPTLFLIDEMLSGTNSSDRRLVAASVVTELVRRGAIGALSTHDLALTEIAENKALHGRNIHFSSINEADPLAFTYQWREGKVTGSNAAAIARLAGIL
jgi:hypothetical protein